MTILFNFARPPFDCLNVEAHQRLAQSLSICYFRAGQVVRLDDVEIQVVARD